VADLPVAVSVDWLVGSVVDGSHGGGHVSGQDGGVSHGVVSNTVVSNTMVSHGETEVSGGGGSQDSGEAEEGLHVV
jgi:hypothetical protein